MNRIIKILFFVIIAFNLILAAWYVLHHDVEFTTEVARDLFLLDELHRKKIILIGPNSTTGLFHGPLWTYVNYPAYFLGNGDPVIVGWWWVVLIAVFLITGFFMAKKLFNSKTAYFFTIMSSVYFVFHAKSLYNPHGAMLIIPAFFFFLIRYAQTQKIKYLVVHIILIGMIIQFQMAIGIPFLILSFFYTMFITIKSKNKKHLLIYSLTFLSLLNFIIFDLRHDFLLSKLVLRFLTSPGNSNLNIVSMFYQRIKFMTTGIEFMRADPGYINLFVFLISSLFLFVQLKNRKYVRIYLSFIYFYFGYLLLSILNQGGLLYFYLFPLFPFAFLIFSSFITSRHKAIFTAVFIAIYLLNQKTAITDIDYAQKVFTGKDQTSWLFLKNAASQLFSGDEKEFGYYVYHPDIIAYRGKYAMQYVQKSSDKKTHYFQKKPVTYLFIAPPPWDNPYMKDDWWKTNLLHLDRAPDNVITFDNGYKIEKYKLSDEEIKVPVESGIDPGIHFR